MPSDEQRDATPRLRVVIVNYRSARLVAERLASPALAGHRVIVVDNASEPDDVRRLCAAHGAVPLLLERNTGFAGGVNAAVRALPGTEPWLLLNPDAELDPTTLTMLADELDGYDGVAPLLVDRGGRPQVGSAGHRLSLSSVTAYFLFLAHVAPRVRGMFLTRRQLRADQDVAWLCAACLLLAPDAFDRYGPLPEDEVVYAEDLAWGTSASKRGARFRLLARAHVVHARGASGGSAAWIDATSRLFLRRLGSLRGRAAVVVLRAGLGVRRMLGRQVT